MNRVAIVGSGRIGQALAEAAPEALALSGRDLFAKRHVDGFLGEREIVIHAAGPAGEMICREDPAMAFALHYTLTQRLVEWSLLNPTRRLILLGTVAPNVGFYGPLKRASIELATLINGSKISVVECGHIIGPGLSVTDSNAGVIARFVKGAVTGSRLVIVSGEQTIRYTPMKSVIECIMALVEEPTARILSPVSAPIPVSEVGRLCLKMASFMYGVNRGVMVQGNQQGQPPSYEDPTGIPVTVPDLSDVLLQWMRTTEVKILLGTH